MLVTTTTSLVSDCKAWFQKDQHLKIINTYVTASLLLSKQFLMTI